MEERYRVPIKLRDPEPETVFTVAIRRAECRHWMSEVAPIVTVRLPSGYTKLIGACAHCGRQVASLQ